MSEFKLKLKRVRFDGIIYTEITSGSELKIGDLIVSENSFRRTVGLVYRLTKKFAFVMMNSDYEMKYPIVYNMCFQSYPKEKWNTTITTAYRKLEVPNES
jgi:hypothetical protein